MAEKVTDVDPANELAEKESSEETLAGEEGTEENSGAADGGEEDKGGEGEETVILEEGKGESTSLMEVDQEQEVTQSSESEEGQGGKDKKVEESDVTGGGDESTKETEDKTEIEVIESDVESKEKEKTPEPKGKPDQHGDFAVLEEDDTEDEGDKEEKEEPMTAADSVSKVTENGEITVAEGKDNEMKTDDDKLTAIGESSPDKSIVLLANPLFGKPELPVIDIVDTDEDDEAPDEEVDSSDYEDLLGCSEHLNGVENGEEDDKCDCSAARQKKSLLDEMKLLRKAVIRLSLRSAVLEDFVQVEYAEKFKTFSKNRDHLRSMGFGGVDRGIAAGKRSTKATELVELLSMIKAQQAPPVNAAENSIKSKPTVNSAPSSTPNKNQQQQKQKNRVPPSSPSKMPNSNRGSSGGGGGATGTKGKPIPSLLSKNEEKLLKLRKEQERQEKERKLAKEGELERRRQQSLQDKIIMEQRQQQRAQERYAHEQAQRGGYSDQRSYYDAMYSAAIAGGVGQSDSRDYVTAVQRSSVYSDPHRSKASAYDYGGTSYSSQERKRKRDSGLSSSDGSVTCLSTTTKPKSKAASGIVPNPRAEAEKNKSSSGRQGQAFHLDSHDEQLISALKSPNDKRVCPVCSRVIARKRLRDHLLGVHENVKMICPMCRMEFNFKGQLKTHMKEQHNLTPEELDIISTRISTSIEEQYGNWILSMQKAAKVPTQAQIIDHYKNAVARDEERNMGAGQRQISDPAPGTRYFGGFAGEGIAPSLSASRAHVSAAGPSSSGDLYGPGGYAQYAANVLQQRGTGSFSAGAGVPRGYGGAQLYTPF